ncbi:modular serine protease-like [Condylostylus longicornis]|uniref:modular serine protease-like n=1 Tax=Condylostylus longicornis TaxID=2530218 RepID=UPI00244E2313|nr:modular serine protease-like [Condylostylus longicornis]
MMLFLNLLIFILLIVTQTLQIFGARNRFTFCSNEEIYKIGTKTVCEYLFIRKPVSCLNPIQVNTKAYINCRYGYASKQNISEQKIGCTYSGKWSEPPMECEDVCDGTPNQITLGLKDKWYIEMKGITTSCPGIILNAKILLTTANCVLEYRPHDLQLETVEPDPQTLVVRAMHYDNRLTKRNGRYDDDALAIVELENNILYDPYVISACIDYNIEPFGRQQEFIRENLEKFKATKTLDYSFIKSPCAPEHFMNVVQNENAVEFNCFLGSRKIPCDKPLEQGSIVKINCKLGYQKTNFQSPDEIKCVSEGKWDRKVDHQCALICGQLDIEKPNIIPLVSNGESIDIVNVPWHVGIYANNTGTGKFEQICGGTLVHFNIVISAAHCFYNEEQHKQNPIWDYMIASGKRYRDYNSFERHAQFVAAKKIHIPTTYNQAFFRHDIAVIVLERKLMFNDHTRPACIDWFPYGKYDIEANKLGRVVGWGATSPDKKSSSKLLAIELNTLSNSQCKDKVNRNNREEITGEKFCAVGFRGESACQGDSGGGFLVKKRYNYDEDRYHLWGIVSSGIDSDKHCTPNFLTTYTNIQYHQDVIKSIIADNI